MNGRTRSVRNGREWAPAVEPRHGTRWAMGPVGCYGPQRRMEAKARTKTAVGLAACVVALAALCWPGAASGAKWVVKGRGWGHGVGMSQYGAYGLAQHGRGYRKILHHYYKHTRIGHAGSNSIKVLLGSGSDSVELQEGEEGLWQAPAPPPGLSLQALGLGRDPAARRPGRIANCGRKRHRRRRRDDPDRRQGRLPRQAKGEDLGRRPAGHQRRRAPGIRRRGWSPTRCRPRGPRRRFGRRRSPRARTRWRPAEAATSTSMTTAQPGLRRQGFRDRRTNKAAKRTSGHVVRHRDEVATTYFFSTSGGQTESVQHGFPGADPVRLSEERPRPL